MKTFEERFTAWIDGQLYGDELAAFEQELVDHEDAMLQRANTVKLGALLREHGAAPALTNQEFFNHSLMDLIHSELPTVPPDSGDVARQKTWWGLPRILWAGGACLLAAMIIFPLITPNFGKQHTAEREFENSVGMDAPVVSDEFLEDSLYKAEVLEASSGDPAVSAVAVNSADKNITVVWLDGLDYIPASHRITASDRAN